MADTDRWQSRLDDAVAERGVPGAALAVLVDGEIHELASGLLNTATGVPATPDSVFLAGSIAKTYTATAVFALIERGALALDTRVADVLPGWDTAITVRQLLSHTGGLTCDFTLDTGRGDDCIARYVEAAADIAPDCPPGAAISYSSVGYAVLGRIVEVLTGQTWDRAITELIVEPLQLRRTMTLPEEALRHRVAMGHHGADPAEAWDLMPRSAGPYGRVIVSAGDLVRFAHAHLDSTLLSPETTATMRRREVDTLDRWSFCADGWGLGWALYDWGSHDGGGVTGFGHDGSAVTQQSWLRVVPGADVAVALLVNSDTDGLYDDVVTPLLQELTGAEAPPPFGVPDDPPEVDLTPWVGRYEREGVTTTISPGRVRYELTGGMAGFAPPMTADLVPVSDSVFAAVDLFGGADVPVVFHTLPDGTPTVIIGMRVTPRVGIGD